MNFLSEYSLWLLPLCLFVGVIYSFLLYYKNRNIEFGRKTTWFLASIRAVVITMICFLLLAPMVKRVVKQTEKPIVVLAVDNSESIVANEDSGWYKNDFPIAYQQLIERLKGKYEVVQYQIGEKVDPILSEDMMFSFSDKTTNLSAVFDEVENMYGTRNLGAMVLFTDAIYNNGTNPFYKAEYLKYPVFTVGMGNSEQQTDLYISSINHNKQTFKGNRFPVEINVQATKLSGKTTKLTVTKGDKEVLTKELNISSSNYYETVKFDLEAEETGTHRYRVTLSSVDGEISDKNNETSFFIQVVDQREKIAIVYNSPHPDVAAIRSSIEKVDKYQVEVFAIEDFKSELSDYSLLILHQLPSAHNSMPALMTKINNSKVSVLYVIGSQTNLGMLNAQNLGFSIAQNKDLTNDASPTYNSNFTLFTFSEEAKQMFAHYPPIETPFGNYKTAGSTHNFIYQKISGVETNYPLCLFNDNDGRKVGAICGTGIWQWKIFNYVYAHNHDAFDELVEKIVLYLSVKSDKSRFRVRTKQVYNENEAIEISAELYNDSYELVNEADVSITLSDDLGKEYQANFSKQNNAYTLNMGELPAGDYHWTASTQGFTPQQTKSGAFSIQELVVESLNLVADHSLLQSIAEATNAQFYNVKDFSEIENQISKNENIKTVASYSPKYNLLLNSWLYITLLMLLLAIEWFIRKWEGGF